MDSQRSGLANGGGSSSARVSTMSNGHRVVHFPLSRSCALKIQKGDITQWSVDGSSDAIVLTYEAWILQKTCGYLLAYGTSYGTSAYTYLVDTHAIPYLS
ncbi:hypothetical protein CsSME_00028827 [Camellia sinensis var. sinensis]